MVGTLKNFGKVRSSFMIKTLNIMKGSYVKPTANSIINSPRLYVFYLTWRMKHGCPLWPLLFNIALKVLVQYVKKWNKRNTNWNGRSKKIICRQSDFLNIKESMEKLLFDMLRLPKEQFSLFYPNNNRIYFKGYNDWCVWIH